MWAVFVSASGSSPSGSDCFGQVVDLALNVRAQVSCGRLVDNEAVMMLAG